MSIMLLVAAFYCPAVAESKIRRQDSCLNGGLLGAMSQAHLQMLYRLPQSNIKVRWVSEVFNPTQFWL